MRVTKAAIAQWQEVSLPGKVDGDMRVQYHDVPPEEAIRRVTAARGVAFDIWPPVFE